MTGAGAKKRATVWALALFIGAVALPMALAGSAPAATSLGGWNVSADANVVDLVVDNATGLAGVHPFTEADFPEAESSFETGPFGSGLASVFWPGSAGGNFGSLSSELPIPAQLQPLLAKANDPVKASTQYPAGPTSASFPAKGSGGVAEMESQSTESGTTSTAALTAESVGGLVSFSGAKGTSDSTATSSATATSTSDLGGISLFGGLIGIGSITSTANATSNGATSSGSSTTDVSGITVLGQATTIGSDGLVLPTDLGNNLGLLGGLTGPIVENLLSQTVTALGLRVSEFPSIQTQSGASDTVSSGGVQIEITPPSSVAPVLETLASKLAPLFGTQLAIVPTLPGLLQGATLTITLGRSTASADASPAYNITPPPVQTTSPSTVPASVTPGSYTAPSSGTPTRTETIPGTPASGTPPGASPSLATSPEASAPVVTPTESTPHLATVPIDISSPLGVLALVLGILATLTLAGGLIWVARQALPEDVGPICPLGQENE